MLKIKSIKVLMNNVVYGDIRSAGVKLEKGLWSWRSKS